MDHYEMLVLESTYGARLHPNRQAEEMRLALAVANGLAQGGDTHSFASLSDSSTVKSYAGSITYIGSLSKTGTYDFETNAGSINMTLPSESSFHLNALTYAGTIKTSFPVTVKRTHAVATANGDVGTSPQATLTLKTNSGSITF